MDLFWFFSTELRDRQAGRAQRRRRDSPRHAVWHRPTPPSLPHLLPSLPSSVCKPQLHSPCVTDLRDVILWRSVARPAWRAGVTELPEPTSARWVVLGHHRPASACDLEVPHFRPGSCLVCGQLSEDWDGIWDPRSKDRQLLWQGGTFVSLISLSAWQLMPIDAKWFILLFVHAHRRKMVHIVIVIGFL